MDLAVLRTTARGLVALAVAGCVASAHAASPYVVGNYPVDATATDAVAAKAQGMADAQKGALRYLMKRLVDVSAYRQLPQLAPAAVEALVESVSVRAEQNSPTEYVATLDFGFRVGAVRQLLQQNGLPFLDKQAPLLTVIPVYAAPAGTAAPVSQTEGQRIWRQAWIGLDLAMPSLRSSLRSPARPRPTRILSSSLPATAASLAWCRLNLVPINCC